MEHNTYKKVRKKDGKREKRKKKEQTRLFVQLKNGKNKYLQWYFDLTETKRGKRSICHIKNSQKPSVYVVSVSYKKGQENNNAKSNVKAWPKSHRGVLVCKSEQALKKYWVKVCISILGHFIITMR